MQYTILRKQQTKVGLHKGTENATEPICCPVLKGRRQMLRCLYSYIVSDLLDQTLMSRPAGFYNCEFSSSANGRAHRKIRLIESNAKWRYLTKFTCKRTLRQVLFLSEAPPLL
jgi:hypothetical protein